MKIIFYKDWNQIGCKAFPKETTIEEAKVWLETNHDMNKVKAFMNDQTLGDPNDPNNPYRHTTVKEFNEKLGL